MSKYKRTDFAKNGKPCNGGGETDGLLRYSILDPTGNITALIEDPVPISRQPAAAAGIMKRHPQVEQVGFVRFADRTSGKDSVHVHLRMAGGEFCGNASMCAAALYMIEKQKQKETEALVTLKVSGVACPVEVTLQRTDELSFQSSINMPRALGMEEMKMEYGSLSALLPIVRMEGISHMIIETDSPFYHLLREKTAAEAAIHLWCGQLEADGLGLMFLGECEGESHFQKNKEERRLIPLVYIPGADTVFWENSCASGSAAAGMYLAEKNAGKVLLTLREPGGILGIESDYESGKTRLSGQVRLIDQVRCNFGHNLTPDT